MGGMLCICEIKHKTVIANVGVHLKTGKDTFLIYSSTRSTLTHKNTITLHDRTPKTQYELYDANTMQKQQKIKNPNFIKKTKSGHSA